MYSTGIFVIQTLEKDVFYPFTSPIEVYSLVLELLSYVISAKRFNSLDCQFSHWKHSGGFERK